LIFFFTFNYCYKKKQACGKKRGLLFVSFASCRRLRRDKNSSLPMRARGAGGGGGAGVGNGAAMLSTSTSVAASPLPSARPFAPSASSDLSCRRWPGTTVASPASTSTSGRAEALSSGWRHGWRRRKHHRPTPTSSSSLSSSQSTTTSTSTAASAASPLIADAVPSSSGRIVERDEVRCWVFPSNLDVMQ